VHTNLDTNLVEIITKMFGKPTSLGKLIIGGWVKIFRGGEKAGAFANASFL
jgi:hypothetical protein